MGLRHGMAGIVWATVFAAGGSSPGIRQERLLVHGIGPPESSLLEGERQFGGLLVDAGCHDRSDFNLHLAPESFPDSLAVQILARRTSGFQIALPPRFLESERADVMAHRVPDLRTRQMDPTCAVTADTREFALLLEDGGLLNLDPGGTTLAWQEILATAPGRAMLHGQGPGLKPYASISGRQEGSTLVVNRIAIAEPRLGP